MKRTSFIIALIFILFNYSFSLTTINSLPDNFKVSAKGKIIQIEKTNIKPRVVLFKDGTIRKFYFANGKLSFFVHFSPYGTMKYKFIPFPKNEYVVYYYNQFEWITKLVYFKNCGSKTVTHFRRMQRAYIVEYNKNGKIIFSGEY